jgi:hypothetical protein
MGKRNMRRVELEALFRWKHELPIFDHNGAEVMRVYQRLVSDRGMEEARLFSLRKSRELRKALRDSNTDEYSALMENLEQAGKEGWVNTIMVNEFAATYQAAEQEAQSKMPKPPAAEAELEEIEEYEHAVDEYNDKRQEEILKIVDKKHKARRKQLESFSDEDLMNKSKAAIENQICNNLVNEIVLHYCTFLGTFEDENCRNSIFNTYKEFDELAPQVKEQLVKGYALLRVGPEELKN